MINKVTLIGNLGKDAELKQYGESQCLTFSLATSRSYKKRDEWVNETTWHNVKIWGDRAKSIANLKKGNLVYVDGRIEHNVYKDDAGNERRSTGIVADYIRNLDREKKGEGTVSTEGSNPSIYTGKTLHNNDEFK